MVNLIQIETIEKTAKEIQQAERDEDVCRACGCIVRPDDGFVTLYGWVCSDCMPTSESELRKLYGEWGQL